MRLLGETQYRWTTTQLCVAGGILALVYLWFWYVALVDAIETAPNAQKTPWVIVIVFVPFGWLLYNLNKSGDTAQGNRFDI
ncbi:MAG TPA: hypothetical protein PLE80_01605 [Opitutaceae bacterium]|jgi:uncharacterized membrane protein|nr:hypothetical protein [Opitutaceae bacterium]